MHGPMTEQGRGGHHRIGAREQIFDYLVCSLHSCARRKRCALQPARKYRQPEQTKPDLVGLLSAMSLRQRKANEIDIALIKRLNRTSPSAPA